MLGDEGKTARAKAVNVIQKTRNAEERNQERTRNQIKNFILPGVTFQQHHTLT